MKRGDLVAYSRDDHLWWLTELRDGYGQIERHSGKGKQWLRQWVPLSALEVPSGDVRTMSSRAKISDRADRAE